MPLENCLTIAKTTQGTKPGLELKQKNETRNPSVTKESKKRRFRRQKRRNLRKILGVNGKNELSKNVCECTVLCQDSRAEKIESLEDLAVEDSRAVTNISVSGETL